MQLLARSLTQGNRLTKLHVQTTFKKVSVKAQEVEEILEKSPHLILLSLNGCENTPLVIQEIGCSHFSQKPLALQSLMLSSVVCSSKALENMIRVSSSLTHLRLAGVKMQKERLLKILTGRTCLHRLHLSHCGNVKNGDEGVFKQQLPQTMVYIWDNIF
jgi:hypothetical protein